MSQTIEQTIETKPLSAHTLKDCWRNCPRCFAEGKKVETPGNNGWPYRLVCKSCNLETTITMHFRHGNDSQMPVWREAR